jgi:hypothetical protein
MRLFASIASDRARQIDRFQIAPNHLAKTYGVCTIPHIALGRFVDPIRPCLCATLARRPRYACVRGPINGEKRDYLAKSKISVPP